MKTRSKQPGARIDDNRAACGLPDRHVAPGVADIVEATLAEFRNETVALGNAAEVGAAIAGIDSIEQPQVGGDALGGRSVGGGRKDQAPPLMLLFIQPGKEFGTPGEGMDIETGFLRHFPLQGSTPLQQPHRQQEQPQRPIACQHQQRLCQQVGSQQGPVEINGQRHAVCRRHRPFRCRRRV